MLVQASCKLESRLSRAFEPERKDPCVYVAFGAPFNNYQAYGPIPYCNYCGPRYVHIRCGPIFLVTDIVVTPPWCRILSELFISAAQLCWRWGGAERDDVSAKMLESPRAAAK